MAIQGSSNNTSGSRSIQLDFSEKESGDCISDKILSELIRRIKGTFEPQQGGDVIRSQDAPSDRTKLWLPVDSQDRPLGGVRRYDSTTNTWIDDSGSGISGNTNAIEFFQKFKTPTIKGTQSVSYDHDELEDDDYIVIITPLGDVSVPHLDEVEGEKGPFSYWVEKTSGSFTVHFIEVPRQGVDIEIAVLKFNNE